ncbi:MAG: hypothetical protein FJ197_07505 [Gammaproteobacteria bacterium]|nr:hypothetical protein [Gammaproteobacteria bacterium]
MSHSQSGFQHWLALCRAAGFDPAEVRLVMGRYQAYRRFYARSRSEPLALPDWFSWYHQETASEVQQNAPTASGCSIDPNAESRGAIRRPAEFVKVLLAFEADELRHRGDA